MAKQIKKSAQVNRLRPKIMERKTRGFKATALHMNKNGVAEPMLQPFAAISMTGLIENTFENGVWTQVTGDGCERKIDRYCRSVLVLNAEESMANVGLVYDIDREAFNTMYRVLSPDGRDKFLVRQGEEALNLVTGETMSREKLKAVIRSNGGYIFSGEYDISSPGQLKKKVLVRFGQYYGPDKSRKIDWRSVFARCTCGAWDILAEYDQAVAKKELSFKEMANVAVRMALNMVCSAMNDTELMNFAVYPGTFRRETVTGADGKPFDFMDGTAPFDTRYLAACVQDALGSGYSVAPSAMMGYVIQCRPFWVCKGTALGMRHEALMDFYYDLSASHEVAVIYRNEMTVEVEKEWERFCFSKGKEGKFADKIVVVLADRTQRLERDLQAFWDFNFQKTVFNLREYRSGLNALSMGHMDHTDGVWSTQIGQSVFMHDMDWFTELLQKDAAREAHEAYKKLVSSEGTAPRFEDFLPSRAVLDAVNGEGEGEVAEVNVSMAMRNVAPHFAQAHFAPEFKQSVNKTMEGLVNRWNKMNVAMDGDIIHTMIITDPVAIITGYRVLNNVSEEGITETIGADFRNVSHEEIVRRIEALPCSEEKKRLAIDFVSNLAPGVSFVPATQEASMLGEGWDFDGDSWYIIKSLGIAIRYPKTHSEGYFRISTDCKLPAPLCVNKDC